MSNEFNVVCGKCQSDIAIIRDPNGELAMCPMCGQRDDLEDAQQIAGEHFLHEMIPGLQKKLGDPVKGNDSIEFTAKPLPRGVYRWHALPLD